MPRRPSNHVDSPEAVGKRLREARETAGLTQAELAAPECTAAYVSRIEAGQRIPSYQLLRAFGKRLGVGADYLATGESEDGDDWELLEAEVAMQLGDDERARALYEAARADASTPTLQAQALLGLGRLALRRSEIDEAIALLENALDADRLNPTEASLCAGTLGRAYANQGRFSEAVALFRRFLDQARKDGNRFDEVRFAVLLANAHIDAGEFGQAQEDLAGVLELARQTVDPRLRASLFWSQSRVFTSQSQPDRAAEYARLTIAILRESEQTIEAARAMLLLAMIENDRGNHEEALALVDEAEPAVVQAGDETEAAMFTIERARALAALGDGAHAVELLRDVIPRLSTAAPVNAGRAYATAAGVFREHGDSARALELYRLSVRISPVLNRHVADSLQAMAEIHEERGETDEALELLKAALNARSGARATA